MERLGQVAIAILILAMIIIGSTQVAPKMVDCLKRGGVPAKTWDHPDGTGCLGGN